MAVQETVRETDRGFLTEEESLRAEIGRLRIAARMAAVEAEKRQYEAVAEALDLLGYAAAREDELDAALLRCIDAIDALAGIRLAGSGDGLAGWRARLDAAWDARVHAMALRTRTPGRASKLGVG
jgi:hypothetical protein